MEFSDKELNRQRGIVFFMMSNIHNKLREMLNAKNTKYIVYIDSAATVAFGNLNLGLTKKTSFKNNILSYFHSYGSDSSYILFEALDKDVKEYSKLEILEKFVDLFENDIFTVFHQLIHHDDNLNEVLDLTSKTKSQEDFVNNKSKYKAYVQETLLNIETEIMLNREKLTDQIKLLEFEKIWMKRLEIHRKDKFHYIHYFTKDHYDELIKHASKVFDGFQYLNVYDGFIS